MFTIDKSPLTARCINKLRKLINAGELKTDGSYINERILRKRLKVSKFTMRRALAQLQAENLLVSVPYKGYVLGSAVSTNRRDRRDTKMQDLIYWVKPPAGGNVRDHFHEAEILKGAGREAEKLGCQIQICRQPIRDLIRNINSAIRARLLGIALDWGDRETADALLLEGIPTVLVEFFYEGIPLDGVTQNDAGGVEQAVAHFWAHGHRRVGLITLASPYAHPLRRRSAFAAALMTRGIVQDHCLGLTPRFDAQGGREALGRLLEAQNPPTAVIISHFELALGVLEEMEKRGLAPGKDLSLVAWGTPQTQAAWLAGTRWAAMPLDLIEWSREEMGAMVVRTLKTRQNQPGMPALRVQIPTRLVIRGSTVDFKD